MYFIRALALMVLFLSACAPAQFERHRWNAAEFDHAAGGDETASLKIIVFDVGQGDATLIESPNGETMLIDAGPPGAGRGVVLPYLKSQGIQSLTYVLATHYHEDHIGGIPEVIAGEDGIFETADDIQIEGGIYDRGEPDVEPENPAFQIYKAQAAENRFTARPGEYFDLGNCRIQIMAAGGVLKDGMRIETGGPPDENALSVATLLECGQFGMFIAADLTGGGLSEPYTTPDIETPLATLVGDVDVLRVAHHGSASGTNEEFLAALSPEVAIISVGDGNEYFHPHESVVERLLGHGVTVYQTERGWLSLDGPIIQNQNILIDVHDDGTFSVR